MSPKFDALEEIAQGTFDVTLPDGTAWKGAIVTPDIRRELQKVRCLRCGARLAHLSAGPCPARRPG